MHVQAKISTSMLSRKLCMHVLTLYLIQAHLNALANRADPNQAAFVHVRAADQGLRSLLMEI